MTINMKPTPSYNIVYIQYLHLCYDYRYTYTILIYIILPYSYYDYHWYHYHYYYKTIITSNNPYSYELHYD